jgi:hypothetical protein
MARAKVPHRTFGPPEWRSIIWRTNAKIKILKPQRRLRQGKKDNESDMNELVIGKQADASLAFNFLGLPREIRDQVYRYVLIFSMIANEIHEKQGDIDGDQGGIDEDNNRENVTNIHSLYDSIHTHASQHFANSPHNPNPLTSLLLVSREIHAETLPLMYQNSSFTIHMDRDTDIFAPRRFITSALASAVDGRYKFGSDSVSIIENFHEHTDAEIREEERSAIPFGWNARLITEMVLRIELGSGDCDGASTVPDFKWPALSQMRSLQKLSVVVTCFQARVTTQSKSTPPVYGPNHEGEEGNGSSGVRSMMNVLFSHIPDHVREVTFGAPGGQMMHHFGAALAYHHPELDTVWLKRSAESLSAFQEWRAKAVERCKGTGKGILITVAETDRDVRYQYSRLHI